MLNVCLATSIFPILFLHLISPYLCHNSCYRSANLFLPLPVSYEMGYIIVVDMHVQFRYGTCPTCTSDNSSLYECVWSVYVYEICLCLYTCVLLRVLLVHMGATHRTWRMNMYNTHMGLYIWVCTYRCSNEIWEINWHFVGISSARTAVFISALSVVPRGVFISFRFILFQ